jgi:hypothetical protein
MKVLMKGRPQRGWSQEFICTGKGNGNGGCGAKLLVEEGDLIRTGCHSYDGSSEYYVTFVCSECGVMTDISGYPGDMWKLKKGPGG